MVATTLTLYIHSNVSENSIDIPLAPSLSLSIHTHTHTHMVMPSQTALAALDAQVLTIKAMIPSSTTGTDMTPVIRA